MEREKKDTILGAPEKQGAFLDYFLGCKGPLLFFFSLATIHFEKHAVLQWVRWDNNGLFICPGINPRLHPPPIFGGRSSPRAYRSLTGYAI